MGRGIGKIGEEIAVKFLKEKGYQILDRNYKFQIPGDLQRGEIDIVAKKGDTICFVEVKTLKDPKIEIFPEDKINFSKKRKLIATAESWLIKNKIPLDSKWQIDVISVEIKGGKQKFPILRTQFQDFRAKIIL
jgi:putative endonuclease